MFLNLDLKDMQAGSYTSKKDGSERSYLRLHGTDSKGRWAQALVFGDLAERIKQDVLRMVPQGKEVEDSEVLLRLEGEWRNSGVRTDKEGNPVLDHEGKPVQRRRFFTEKGIVMTGPAVELSRARKEASVSLTEVARLLGDGKRDEAYDRLETFMAAFARLPRPSQEPDYFREEFQEPEEKADEHPQDKATVGASANAEASNDAGAADTTNDASTETERASDPQSAPEEEKPLTEIEFASDEEDEAEEEITEVASLNTENQEQEEIAEAPPAPARQAPTGAVRPAAPMGRIAPSPSGAVLPSMTAKGSETKPVQSNPEALANKYYQEKSKGDDVLDSPTLKEAPQTTTPERAAAPAAPAAKASPAAKPAPVRMGMLGMRPMPTRLPTPGMGRG